MITPIIYIDFKNPASYLALRPTCALLDELGVTARWLPFGTNEEAIPEQKAEETRGEKHRRVRAIARRETHLLYAGVQGIDMQFLDNPGETDTCLAALALLEENPLPFIRAAFESYWVHGDNLNDEEIVQALWDNTAPGLELDLPTGLGRLAQIREEATEDKVFLTPSYLIGDQVFLGREHLPWIRELMEGSP